MARKKDGSPEAEHTFSQKKPHRARPDHTGIGFQVPDARYEAFYALVKLRGLTIEGALNILIEGYIKEEIKHEH